MNQKPSQPLMLLLGWVLLSSIIAFFLFGYDKWRASRGDHSRIKEFHLVVVGALGGWPGGLLGMLAFRHKTSKLSFQLKYALSFLCWALWMYFAVTKL